MGKVEGWIGIKNSRVFVKRVLDDCLNELQYNNCKGGYDIETLGALLSAIPLYTQDVLKCMPYSIVFFNKLEGKGRSFKYAWYKDLTSILIEEVDKDSDFIYLGDTRAEKMMKTCYVWDKKKIEKFNGNLTPFKKSVNRFIFRKKFNKYNKKSFEGKEKYISRALTVYGYVDNGEVTEYFANNITGADLIEYSLPQRKFSQEEVKKYLFNLIETVRKVYSSLYLKENKLPEEGISFLTLTNKENIYEIIEYKKKSKIEKNQDCLGILIQMQENEKGILLKELIKKAFTSLKENFEIFKKAID